MCPIGGIVASFNEGFFTTETQKARREIERHSHSSVLSGVQSHCFFVRNVDDARDETRAFGRS
jgi:hypothetical protein